MRTILSLLVIWHISSASIFSQPTNYEKVALKTLLDNTFLKEYGSKAVFHGRTESNSKMFLAIFDNIDHKEISAAQKYKDMAITIKHDKIKLKRHWFGNKPEIKAYSDISFNNKHYVYITVYKRNHYVGHHLYIFDDKGSLLEAKKASEII